MERPIRLTESIAPPLGIEPKYIWEMRRATDLRDAIYRYTNVCLEVPVRWVEEYNELIKKGVFK
jgi:hypothetical protein